MNTPLDEPAEADVPPPGSATVIPKDAPEKSEPDRSPPRDACDTGGFSSAGQRQVLSADRK